MISKRYGNCGRWVRALHVVSPAMSRSPRSTNDGFTLLELMMVITVISILVGIAGPGLARGFADIRARGVITDVMNEFNFSQSRARGYGRAQLLRFTGANEGTVEHFDGNTNSCVASDWGNISGSTCDRADARCLNVIAAGDRSGTETWSLEISTSATSGWDASANVEVCYDSRGTMHWRPGGTPTWSTSLVGGGIRFQLVRPQSVSRVVVVPLGGAARRVR